MLFEEIDAGLQKTEGMILSHKEPEGLKDILPIPKPLVYMQILPDHFTAIRYDWMKQGGGNPYDMEHIVNSCRISAGSSLFARLDQSLFASRR